MSKSEKYGMCLLTKARGKFVKSHLIPKALTRPSEPGAAMLQAGNGGPVTKRFDSWYDTSIVIRAGEDALARIDTKAIEELRRRRLVWSSWGSQHDLGELHIRLGDSHVGIRKIADYDAHVLRMFSLSLLWRAAVSNRVEFAEVMLPAADIERIRELILADDPGPIDFYPTAVIQLSTIGLIHNLTPIAQNKHIPEFEGSSSYDIPIIRFYFDGLILHVHKYASDEGMTAGLGGQIIGGDSSLVVTTVTYENSFQAQNIANIIADATYLDPDEGTPGDEAKPAP